MNDTEVILRTVQSTIGHFPQDKDISMMQELVRGVNQANGWFDESRTFGDDIALLHSEVSECFEAYRDWHIDDMTKQLCKDHPEPYKGYEKHFCKPEGVGSELADILVRLLDTCERYKIDLENEFNRKMIYNATRGYKHGNKAV